MASIFQLPSSEQADLYEDLIQQILVIYRDVATHVLEVPPGGNSQRQELLTQARELCARLESMLSIIADEQDNPELSPEELEEYCADILAEAKSLERQLRAIIQRLHSIER